MQIIRFHEQNLDHEAGRSRLRPKKGTIEQLYTAPPERSLVVCLDEMGPQSAKSFPGQQLVLGAKRPAQRARQEIDDGRRGTGYVFGAFCPATGAVLTSSATRRTTATVVAFLEQTEDWIDPEVERIYLSLDHLFAHRTTDVLLFALTHPRFEFVV